MLVASRRLVLAWVCGVWRNTNGTLLWCRWEYVSSLHLCVHVSVGTSSTQSFSFKYLARVLCTYWCTSQ